MFVLRKLGHFCRTPVGKGGVKLRASKVRSDLSQNECLSQKRSICPMKRGCQVILLDTFLWLSTVNLGGGKISRENIHQIVTSCHVLEKVIKLAKIPAKTRFVLQNWDPRVKGVKAQQEALEHVTLVLSNIFSQDRSLTQRE